MCFSDTKTAADCMVQIHQMNEATLNIENLYYRLGIQPGTEDVYDQKKITSWTNRGDTVKKNTNDTKINIIRGRIDSYSLLPTDSTEKPEPPHQLITFHQKVNKQHHVSSTIINSKQNYHSNNKLYLFKQAISPRIEVAPF